MNRRTLSIGGIVLAVICFVALNTWGSLSLRHDRLDLTQTGQFTLAEGTKKLLGKVKEPVTLRLYVSKSVRDANPFLATYADRVHDLLRTYAAQSNGKITVDYIDPEPFSPAEDRAVGFGLQPISLGNGDDLSGYFGIAGTNSTDDIDVIPVLSPDREAFLEYDLTRLVYNLANPDKPVAAVISSLPLNGDPANQYKPWAVTDQLKQFFSLRYLGGDVTKLDPDVKVLLLVQPQNLSDKTRYAIDNFVLKGGKAMVFVDPHSEAQALRSGAQPGMPQDTSSGLPRLFSAWGLDLVPDKIVGDQAAARQVSYPSGGRDQVVDYVAWLSLDKSNMAQDDVTTSELGRINVATAGILEPQKGATTTFKPLLMSSPQAMEIDADKVRMYPDPFGLLRDFKPGNKPLVMAARIAGPARTAFPGGRPKDDKDGPEPVAQSAGPINVVVVADTDLLDDRNWLASQSSFGQDVQIPIADNANFVANAMDYLAGSDELIGLRGREVTYRPFLRVQAIQRAAQQQYQAKEQALTDQLRDLQTKINALRPSGNAGGDEAAMITDQQKQEVEGFRGQLLETRRQLRAVQLALRQDIEGLRDRLRFLNIAAVPLVVALFAVLLALVQRARYRRRVDAASA